MKYTQRHLDRTPHNLKYKYGESFKATEITYHQTSNKAPAINERNYLNNRTDKQYIGFHIVVDDKQAIECLPLNIQSWHSGDGSNGAGNMKSIGIEIAYSTHDDVNLRNKAIENGAEVIAKVMKDYNIPLNKVKSHYDRSKKNCPHDIRGRYGESKFRNLIQQKYNELVNGQTTQPTETAKTNSKGEKLYYRVAVNSFTNKSNANAQVDKLKKQGFDSFLVAFKKDGIQYFRVIAGSYTLKSKALEQQNKLKSKGFDSFLATEWIK